MNTLNTLVDNYKLDGSEKIVEEENDRVVTNKDGKIIHLSDLTEQEYWVYMSMREHKWYEK